ncbi:hypothetical protein ACWD6T_18835, partial [Streptomyces albidoflavus]
MLARERQPSQAQQRGAGRAEPRATGRGEGPLDPYRPSMYFYCGNEHAVVDAALRVLDERVLTPVRRAAGTEGARTARVLGDQAAALAVHAGVGEREAAPAAARDLA